MQRGELQRLKTPAKKEERAVNVEEIRLPWKLCEYKENLLARGTGVSKFMPQHLTKCTVAVRAMEKNEGLI